MSLERTVYFNQLFAIYQALLTEKQREMLRLFYEEDFSLSEIADHYHISRQGVHDNIKRGEQALEAYEMALALLQQSQDRLQRYRDLLKTPDLPEVVQRQIQTLMELEYEL